MVCISGGDAGRNAARGSRLRWEWDGRGLVGYVESAARVTWRHVCVK